MIAGSHLSIAKQINVKTYLRTDTNDTVCIYMHMFSFWEVGILDPQFTYISSKLRNLFTNLKMNKYLTISITYC